VAIEGELWRFNVSQNSRPVSPLTKLAEARESIYILDWWLSPEIYLRRPPSRNEQYRLDNMLKAAAERGVKVNVIVYKEVEQALTC
jgi:phospholipase D1/2